MRDDFGRDMTPSYEFVLKFRLTGGPSDSSRLMAALGEAGCTDAIVGVGQMGIIGLDFSREAACAQDAFMGAIRDVRHAIPEAELIEAAPDLVGLTQVADLIGYSRQYVRKVVHAHADTFPAPVHEGKPSLWHLWSVLRWMELFQHRKVDPALGDIARLAMSANMLIAEREIDRLEIDEMRLLIS